MISSIFGVDAQKAMILLLQAANWIKMINVDLYISNTQRNRSDKDNFNDHYIGLNANMDV